MWFRVRELIGCTCVMLRIAAATFCTEAFQLVQHALLRAGHLGRQRNFHLWRQALKFARRFGVVGDHLVGEGLDVPLRSLGRRAGSTGFRTYRWSPPHSRNPTSWERCRGRNSPRSSRSPTEQDRPRNKQADAEQHSSPRVLRCNEMCVGTKLAKAGYFAANLFRYWSETWNYF